MVHTVGRNIIWAYRISLRIQRRIACLLLHWQLIPVWPTDIKKVIVDHSFNALTTTVWYGLKKFFWVQHSVGRNIIWTYRISLRKWWHLKVTVISLHSQFFHQTQGKSLSIVHVMHRRHPDKSETLSLWWYTRWAETSFGPTEFPCKYGEDLLVCYCIDKSFRFDHRT